MNINGIAKWIGITTLFAGVRLRWKRGTAQGSTAAKEGDCTRHPVEIQIDFVSGLPGGLSSKALAQTYPYSQDGLRIDVFVDQLRPMFRSRPLRERAVGAHNGA